MPLLPENNPLLQEIHTTEETYNAQLVELIRRLNVLQPSEPGLAFIEPMVVQLTKMLGISKELLKASKGGTDVNAMLQQYLNIQAEISETFKKYPPLVSQFNTWWAKLNDEEKNRIDKATKDSAPPQFSSLSLSDFPIMPVQRLIRYELFCHELIKKNPAIPVYSAFQAAVKPEAKA
ncbi:MAG TPA: RhoGEF domain-containing protein, partial [Gammaproteobacteria bacterium]|nr:RhoGEF domain-containing protein [Gammaproteobacteria bacterium]